MLQRWTWFYVSACALGALAVAALFADSPEAIGLDDVILVSTAAAVGAVVLALADHGAAGAMRLDPHLRNGLNVAAGLVTEPHVAEALGYEHYDPSGVLDQL